MRAARKAALQEPTRSRARGLRLHRRLVQSNSATHLNRFHLADGVRTPNESRRIMSNQQLSAKAGQLHRRHPLADPLTNQTISPTIRGITWGCGSVRRWCMKSVLQISFRAAATDFRWRTTALRGVWEISAVITGAFFAIQREQSSPPPAKAPPL